jgi:hypothetical protein
MLAARQNMATRPHLGKDRVAVMRCTHRRETAMFTIRRSRSLFLGSAAFLALALFVPGVVNADEAIPVTAPVAGPSTDAVPVVAPVAAPSWDATSGYGSVEASRAAASALLAPVAAPSWDETSGYASVETSRATIGHLAANTTQVPSDVRWAPTLASAPMAPVETSYGTNPEYIPAALASGLRVESAHLATVLLPREDAVGVRRTQH